MNLKKINELIHPLTNIFLFQYSEAIEDGRESIKEIFTTSIPTKSTFNTSLSSFTTSIHCHCHSHCQIKFTFWTFWKKMKLLFLFSMSKFYDISWNFGVFNFNNIKTTHDKQTVIQVNAEI